MLSNVRVLGSGTTCDSPELYLGSHYPARSRRRPVQPASAGTLRGRATNTKALLSRLADILRRSNWPRYAGLSCISFCLLCGYYVLRPVRDEMGIQAGLGNLAVVVHRDLRRNAGSDSCVRMGFVAFSAPAFLPYVYLFFVVNLLIFFVLFKQQIALAATTKAFFVWVSVFNLFVISVFWSFMADLYNTAQARRLYGLITAGGSVGAVTGPALTTVLALPLGPVNLLLVSAGFLLAATFCILRLLLGVRPCAWAAGQERSTRRRRHIRRH